MDYVFPTIILIALITTLITIGLKLLRPKQEKMKAIATFAIKSFANGFIGGLGFALAMYILFLLFANSINL